MTEGVLNLRVVSRDGEQVVKLQCPGCGQWCDLDDDQYHGRVSVWHDVPGCGYHQTVDFENDERVRFPVE